MCFLPLIIVLHNVVVETGKVNGLIVGACLVTSEISCKK